MEAPEVPLEQVHEDIHHNTTAHHRADHPGEASWTRYIALSTAIIAALAAVASLCAGHTETEAMYAKMTANDQWSYYQAKSIKLNQLENTAQLIAALGKQAEPDAAAKATRYEHEKSEIQAEAQALDRESARYLEAHTRYGYGVTMFQIAIALSAISALTRRRRYWLFSLGLGGIGIAFALYGAALQHLVSGAEHAPEQRSAAPGHAAGNG